MRKVRSAMCPPWLSRHAQCHTGTCTSDLRSAVHWLLGSVRPISQSSNLLDSKILAVMILMILVKLSRALKATLNDKFDHALSTYWTAVPCCSPSQYQNSSSFFAEAKFLVTNTWRKIYSRNRLWCIAWNKAVSLFSASLFGNLPRLYYYRISYDITESLQAITHIDLGNSKLWLSNL